MKNVSAALIWAGLSLAFTDMATTSARVTVLAGPAGIGARPNLTPAVW